MFSLALLALLPGCKRDPASDAGPDAGSSQIEDTAAEPVVFAPFTPAPASLQRISSAEWRNAVEDLLGVRYEGVLPLDYLLYNYTRVGGSELAIPPLDLEQYETAAWEVAEQAAPDLEAATALLGCDIEVAVCVRNALVSLAQRAWRRPPETVELDEVMASWQAVADSGGGPLMALQTTLASVLMSPDFLFRVELGQDDPAHPGWRRYTSTEMAGRLASFLTASVPDEELMRAGLAGELLTDAAILAQTDRLMQTDRAREALTEFFAETLSLQEIDALIKDDPAFTDALRAEMGYEMRLLFQEIAFERQADLADLLTTNTSFVGPALASLYEVPSGAGPTEVTLPAEHERGGILGRAAFLAIESHVTVNSPTRRGKFVRTRLLCEDIPPPPPGVATELAEVEGGTLRDQLEEHATNPACSGCHVVIDPPGFALEHFDPIGRFRELDNGLPIDATGDLDGVSFDGAAELGAVVAENPKFTSCLTLSMYRFANAALEREEDLGLVDALAKDILEDGRGLNAIVRRLVLSDGFRLLTAPRGETCTVEGETRQCANDCGSGTEICADGRWQGCTAPAPGLESCNGLDDDCDGLTDESVEQACDIDGEPGTQICEAGDWLACEGPPPPGPTDEVCNGLDDDLDGDTDEDLSVSVETVSIADLTAAHGGCDPLADAFSADCHAAASRACPALGCSITGFGPVEVDDLDSTVALSCLDAASAVTHNTTFSELSTYHDGCNIDARQGGACNAAINRYCATLGETTGFGPVENYGDLATVVCTPPAAVYDGSYITLSTYDVGCNGYTRVGASCNRAIHLWCRDQGHRTGHGPLENSGDLAIIACLGAL